MNRRILLLIFALISSTASGAFAQGQSLSDNFDRASLGPDWVVDGGAFSLVNGELREDSGQRYTTARMRYVGSQTDSVDQFGKLQVIEQNTHSWGFVFREDVNGPGVHYEVLLRSNGTWRWDLHNPDFVEKVGECFGDGPLQNGQWIGAAVEGTGSQTVVSGWRWPADPDNGSGVDIGANWGAPDCQIIVTAPPQFFVDTGRTVGIRSYTGSSTAFARADHWAGGDMDAVASVCGNGVAEPPEACDDGGATATCDADCTLPMCGDGTLNPLAGEMCEGDGDCLLGEFCDAGCACVLTPVCGNAVLEPPEACDDGGATATCDADCTLPMCGDGTLNPLAGEMCEGNGDCPTGEVCRSCACEVPMGQLLSDNFDRASLGPDWVVDGGAFSLVNGELREDSGQRYTTARMRYVGSQTDSVDQFGKLQVIEQNTHSWGFVFREDVNGPGVHYEVLLRSNGTWRWDLHNPDFVEKVGECFGDGPLQNGQWIGAAVEGTGSQTVVSGWRWPADPDNGSGVDIGANWGAPDCQIIVTAPPQFFVDTGRTVGIRSYTGSSTAFARADHWAGGDMDAVASVCGNGVAEPPEACDDGGATATCDADCTLPMCGDGTLNPLAGEMCEGDGDCLLGEFCDAGCACVLTPVCGNAVLEPPEACDDGGATATCDADCTLPMCGDGTLNPLAGEMCEGNGDCPTGEVCRSCACEVPMGQLLSDNFDRASLGPDWVVDGGAFSLVNGELREDSGQRYTTARMRYVGSQTDSVDQFGKLQVIEQNTHSWGFVFREDVNGPGVHYEVLLRSNGTWRWDLHNPDFVEKVGECFGDGPLQNGQWIGAAVEGTGSQTVVSGWRWPADPDNGSGVDIGANWGAPDCQIIVTAPPQFFVDTGRTVGIRSYTGSSTAFARADHWAGGDVIGSITPPIVGSIALLLDSTGAGAPNSMIDPDGIAVDSVGNVYIAACGLGPSSTGLFKVSPLGVVTKVIDASGDDVNAFDCGVGVDVDSSDNVYVTAFLSNNVFRLTPTGEITQLADSSGVGVPNSLVGPIGVAVDSGGNVYVSSFFSDTVHKISSTGLVSEVLNSTGDGVNSFTGPFEVTTDLNDNVYVAGFMSDNVFEITPSGQVSIVLDSSGDGINPLGGPHGVGTDGNGNVYVSGNSTDNVFRIDPLGVVTQILDASGDGISPLDNPTGLKATTDGRVYVTAFESDNAFEWDDGAVRRIISQSGDGSNQFRKPADDSVAVDNAGRVYVTGTSSDTVFEIDVGTGTQSQSAARQAPSRDDEQSGTRTPIAVDDSTIGRAPTAESLRAYRVKVDSR